MRVTMGKRMVIAFGLLGPLRRAACFLLLALFRVDEIRSDRGDGVKRMVGSPGVHGSVIDVPELLHRY